jgi:hypothetical protein
MFYKNLIQMPKYIAGLIPFLSALVFVCIVIVAVAVTELVFFRS